MQTMIDPVSLQLPQTVEPRNPGQDFDADWLRSLQANTSAIERRAKTLPGRRSQAPPRRPAPSARARYR